MFERNLEANLKFITDNEKRFLEYYRDKFVLVFDQNITNSYDSFEKAAAEGVRLYGLEAGFVVHHIMERGPLNIVMEVTL